MRGPVASARTLEHHLKQRRKVYSVRQSWGMVIVGDGGWVGVRLKPGAQVAFDPWPPTFLACLTLLCLATLTAGLAIPVWRMVLQGRTDALACDVAHVLRTELGQRVPRALR